MKKKLAVIIICAMITFASVMSVSAQSSDITIKFSRDFGYSSIGTNEIQGLFSITASSVSEIESVVYYIDDEILGEVFSEPYKFQFNTDDYPEGQHKIFAKGKSETGEILRSQEIATTFISSEASRAGTIKLIVPILGLTLLVSILAFVIPAATRKKKGGLPLGTQRKYGSAGGTICSKCKRPFERHVISPNLLVGKLEICPHCGKWGIYRSLPLDTLRQSEKDELEGSTKITSSGDSSEKDDEILRKQLDDSRFDD